MGGQDLGQDIASVGRITAADYRKAAVHLADRIAAQHPTDFDETAPEYAGRLVGLDPTVRTTLRDLLDAIGYTSKEQT